MKRARGEKEEEGKEMGRREPEGRKRKRERKCDEENWMVEEKERKEMG